MRYGIYITDYEIERAELFGGGFEAGRIIGECVCCGRDVESGEAVGGENGEILCSEACRNMMLLLSAGGARRRRLRLCTGEKRFVFHRQMLTVGSERKN